MYTYKNNSRSGFTTVELIVMTVISVIIGAAIIGITTTLMQQFSITSTRQQMNTDAQRATAIISEDIQQSTSVMLYNPTPDPNAPVSITGEYTNITVPEENRSQPYNWRMGKNRLILAQPARSADGSTIYSDTENLVASMNTVVYYVKNSTLYRRLIAASDNARSTQICAPIENDGGCTQGSVSDEIILRDLSSGDGLGSFELKYFDSDGEEISNRDGSGNPLYSNFEKARMVSVNFESKKNQGGTTVTESKSTRAGIRTGVAQEVTSSPTFAASVVSGPKGLRLFWDSVISVSSVATQGSLSATYGSRIGSASKPANITVANKGCGSGTTYGSPCGGQPINTFWYGRLTGDICATGQSSSDGIRRGDDGTLYTKGLISGCTAPDVRMPVFDKQRFVNGMNPAGRSSSEVSCGGNGNKTTLRANTRYDGNILIRDDCETTLEGNVYLRNNLRMEYGGRIKVKDGITERPIIVINGKFSSFWHTKIIPNNYGVSPYIISFWSSDSACSNSDSCDVQTSSRIENSNESGIYISYNTTAPGTLFYSYFSSLDMFYNSATKAGGLAGQRVNIEFSGDVTLDQ
jgi:type II secretory pathway component PulJ